MDPLEEYLSAKAAPGGDDPLATYLDSKQGDRRARLEAKHKANVKELRQLRANPENTFGDYVNAAGGALGEKLAGMGRGALAVGEYGAHAARHPLDTVSALWRDDLPEEDARRRQLVRGVADVTTLGYGNQLADYIASRTGGTTLGASEAADAQVAPDLRTGGQLVGSFLPGAVNAIGRGAGAVAGKAIPVAGAVGGAGRAALGYELAAPAISGLHAGAEGHRLEAAGAAATDPANIVLATAGGAAGGAIANAPARAEASELAGLKTGVQNKTRVQKFVPHEDDIRAQLRTAPEVRAMIKQDPVKAQPMVEQALATKADTALEPFYRQMTASGQDQIPVNLVTDQLKAVRGGFNRVTEKAQIAAIDDYIAGFEAEAAGNNGRLPAQFVRESATSVQSQGFANVPMFGQVALSKGMKQDVGNALRGAVADHVESLTPNTAAGKALREAFGQANREVSTWYRIKDIVDEKATRLQGNATPMADVVHAVGGAIHSPLRAALGMVPKAADVLDRRVLSPAASSRPGQWLMGGVEPAPVVAGQEAGPANPVMSAYEAERERNRRRAALARRTAP